MSMRLTLDDVREILSLLDESPYDEMSLQTDSFSVSFKRTADDSWTQETITASRADRKALAEDSIPAEAPKALERESVDADIHQIRAALPGTFYRAPKPGAEPFVQVGVTVDDATTVAIIETMKLMNSVAADCSGEVIDICVDNGETVDKGDVLIHVRTTEK